MKKSKPWACQHKCDLSQGVICKHLEALLPQMNDGKTQYIGDDIASNMSLNIFHVQFPMHNHKVMLDRVKSYGILDKWDLELLEARFTHNLSLRDIANKFGYVSFKTVQRRLKKIAELLRERGFQQEME